jgi:hypothetical protein
VVFTAVTDVTLALTPVPKSAVPVRATGATVLRVTDGTVLWMLPLDAPLLACPPTLALELALVPALGPLTAGADDAAALPELAAGPDAAVLDDDEVHPATMKMIPVPATSAIPAR